MAHSLDQIDWCDVPLVSPHDKTSGNGQSAATATHCTYVAQFVAPVPWLLESDELLHARVTPHVDVDLHMLINLVVAMDNSCRHCYGAFRSILKIMGYPEKEIRRIEETLTLDALSPRERLALDFARRVSRSDPRPDATDIRKLTDAGYERLEIAEIVYLAGTGAAGTRIATLLALPPDPVEHMESAWYQRLLRPLTRQRFREHVSAVWEADGDPEFSGPGARIVDELRGSPAANALATTLGGAWSSEITSPRLKAIIFAVIARGLECPSCESEAISPLRNEGWSEDEIGQLLTHLASAKLDPFEIRTLQFARDTIRYRTRRLQETTRQFAEEVDREVLLEIVGLVSYFNGLVRMGILLGHC